MAMIYGKSDGIRTTRFTPNAEAHGIAFALFMSASSIAAAETCSVAVDAGHTVGQPGDSSAREIPEFQFNQALAKALHNSLLAKDCQVAMVNEDGDIGAL